MEELLQVRGAVDYVKNLDTMRIGMIKD